MIQQAEIEKLMTLNAEQARKIMELSQTRHQHLKNFVEWLQKKVSFVDKNLIHLSSEDLLREYMKNESR